MSVTFSQWQTIILWRTRKTWVSLCTSKEHPEFCYRDASDKTWPVSWDKSWYFYTGNTWVEFQKNEILGYLLWTVYDGSESTSYYDPQNWEIVPVRINEWTYYFQQFQKRNRKLATTKLPFQVSRAIYIGGVGFLPWCLVVFFIFKVLPLLFY